jgi:hypothetical protein
MGEKSTYHSMKTIGGVKIVPSIRNLDERRRGLISFTLSDLFLREQKVEV